MNFHIKKISVSLILALTLCSCKTTSTAKPVAETPSTKPIDTNSTVVDAEFYQAVSKRTIFDQVKINSKIRVEMGSFVPPSDATIYIENGQKIWMNISAFFVNVARGVATPQGIKGYEKVSNSYIESDFSYLNKLLNVNFINYNSFQNMLLGRTFFPVNPTDFKLTKNAQGYTLSTIENQKIIANGKTSEYKISMDYSPTYDLSHVILQDIKTPDNLEVYYSGWTSEGSLRVPQNVKIILKGQKTGQILIENTKFDFSKMETPYTVPSNYTKKEIR